MSIYNYTKFIQYIRWILPKENCCLQLHLFRGNQLWWILPCSRKLPVLPSLPTAALELFLYLRVSVFPLHGLSFPLRLLLTHQCLAHLLTFFTKTCFSVHIPYSSVNFTSFALLSQQKFNDRPLFKPGALWYAAILNSKIFENKYFWVTKIIFVISQFQTMHSLYLWKKILKNYFVLSKNSPYLNDPYIYWEFQRNSYNIVI